MMTITPAQCRAARGLVELDQAHLAQRAHVSRNVIVDFEKGRRTPTVNNLAAIRSALEAAGVEFTNGGQPGVRTDLLRMRERNAQLRGQIDEALKLVDRSVSSKVDLIHAEFFKSHEEPQSLLESFDRLQRQQQVLEAAGVEFTNGDEPGVRLRKGR
jgi:transcriptional regulator with XRE-family HTH domain